MRRDRSADAPPAGRLAGRAAAAAAIYGIVLLIAVSPSTPRRVGDGGEYFVMATRLAAFKHPAMTRAEIDDTRQELTLLGSGFESALLDYPRMIASDGRQDFLHYWLYPLLAAPFVPLAETLGLHPNWAFTLANVLMLAAAVFVVARCQPLVVILAGFASPIVWWADKAHTEAFLFATVAAAAVIFQRTPSAAMVLYAMAGAQNAAIGVTFPVFVLMLQAAVRKTRPWARQEWVALAISAMIIVSPFGYTWMRLGRLSAMAEYATATVPHWSGVAGFILDPNIGLAASAPVYLVAIVCVVLLARRRPAPALFWWPAAIQGMLLVVWSQNPNANHGGTPNVNRWVLSLLALSLPWVGAAYESSPRVWRRVITALVAGAAIWSVYFHLPARPENYLRPTRLAGLMWHAGWLRVTPAEVFAERSQGREPARVPASFGPCAAVLVADLQWPLDCVPPDATMPPVCRRAGAMCYVIGTGDGRRVVAAANNGFFFVPGVPSWPAGGPLASGIGRVLTESDPTARSWRTEAVDAWQASAEDLVLESVLRSNKALVIYVVRTGDSPVLRVRAAGFTRATVYALTPFATVDSFTPLPDPAAVPLPARTSNLAIALRTAAE